MLVLSRIHETLFYEATLPNADEISKYRLWTEMEKFRRLRKFAYPKRSIRSQKNLSGKNFARQFWPMTFF